MVAPSNPDVQDGDPQIVDGNQEGENEDGRQRWSSRLVFIFAAIGSAVGLGNVWRFPYYVTKFGGGTFLIPYTICLVFIGMPILLMELALGQVFQGGDVEAFGALNPRCRGIGLMSIWSSFLIICYYAVVNTWSLCYMFRSFEDLPWTTVPKSEDYFYNELLQFKSIKPQGAPDFDHGSEYDGSWRLLMGLVATWFCIYFCVFQGVTSAGEVVKFTVPVPILLLLILMFAAVSKEGAGGGLDQYLGKWSSEGFETQDDGSNVWTAATAQVFFTLSVTMGVMTAYSSFNPRNQNIVMDEKYISLGDFFIAFISGFTIYALLGHTVHNCENEPIETNLLELYGTENCEGLYSQVSIGLAFVMFPYGLSTIDGGPFWCVIFFMTLFLLGIDSAFSMIEAITTVISDMELSKRYKFTKSGITQLTCVVCFCVGTIYTMDTGLDNFDIVDHYVNSYNLLTVGFLECFATAWVYKIETQTEKVGPRAVYFYNTMSMIALLVGVSVGFGTTDKDESTTPNNWGAGSLSVQDAGIVGTFTGIGIWLIAIIGGFALAGQSYLTSGQKLWAIMGWPGPDALRSHVNTQHYPDWQPNVYAHEMTALCSWTTIPFYWGFLLKYLIPALLMVMLANGVREDHHAEYGKFTKDENGLGLAGYILGLIMMIVPVICPILFMSNKEAFAFQGWDLMVMIGVDPRNFTCLGFYRDEYEKSEDGKKISPDKKRRAEDVQMHVHKRSGDENKSTWGNEYNPTILDNVVDATGDGE